MSALRRFLFSGLAVLMVALAAVAYPEPAQAYEPCYDCGRYRGLICAEKKTCTFFFFGCTTAEFRWAS